MPWVEIPPEQIDQLSLFGYELLKHKETGAWYRHADKGRVFIRYARPVVWTEDMATAGQIGAINIFQGDDERKDGF